MKKLRTLKSQLTPLPNHVPAKSTVRCHAPAPLTPRLRGRAGLRRRDRVLRRYPLCAICESEGRVTASVVADHRHALVDGGSDDERGMWGLCDACHRRKTSDEAARRARGEATSKPLSWLPPMKAPREPVIA